MGVQLTLRNKSVTTSLTMCDKPSSELLSQIEGAKTDDMKHVQTRERVASTHDMALVGIGNFDKTKLKNQKTEGRGQKLEKTKCKFRIFLFDIVSLHCPGD